MSTARGLLEIAKVFGRAEVIPGYILLFTRDFLKINRAVLLDDTHALRIKKTLPDPYIFCLINQTTEKTEVFATNGDEGAIYMIDSWLTSAKGFGWAVDDWPASIPDFIPAETEFNKIQ